MHRRPPLEPELGALTLWPESEKVFGHGYEVLINPLFILHFINGTRNSISLKVVGRSLFSRRQNLGYVVQVNHS